MLPNKPCLVFMALDGTLAFICGQCSKVMTIASVRCQIKEAILEGAVGLDDKQDKKCIKVINTTRPYAYIIIYYVIYKYNCIPSYELKHIKQL